MRLATTKERGKNSREGSKTKSRVKRESKSARGSVNLGELVMGQLRSRISKYELTEPGVFFFLQDIPLRWIARVDEVHPSQDADDHYIFLVWIKPEKHAAVERQVSENLERIRDWDGKVLPNTGKGLIIVSLMTS